MLRVQDRYVIQDLHKKGVSISEIARVTGRDRKTVRVVIKQPLLLVRPDPKSRVRKLDPWVEHLQRRIAEEADKHGWTYVDFLDRLLGAEVATRSERDIAMKTKRHTLPAPRRSKGLASRSNLLSMSAR